MSTATFLIIAILFVIMIWLRRIGQVMDGTLAERERQKQEKAKQKLDEQRRKYYIEEHKKKLQADAYQRKQSERRAAWEREHGRPYPTKSITPGVPGMN